MSRALAAVVVALCLPLAGCSWLSDDGDDPAALVNGELLVVSTDATAVLRLDPTSGLTTAIDRPAELEDGTPQRVVAGPDGEHALIDSGSGIYLWSRSTDQSTLIGHGGQFQGGTPRAAPVVVLVEVHDGSHLVDLRDGSILPLGVLDQAYDLSLDGAGGVAFVGLNFGGGLAIDLEDGAVVEYGQDLFFPDDPLSVDGSLVARRPGPNGQAVLVGDALDPSSLEPWYEPASRERQVSVAWVGDVLIGVDIEGRVLTLDRDRQQELGNLDHGEIRSVNLRGDPSLDAILIEEGGPSGSRWFRVVVDGADRSVRHLGSLDGLEQIGYGVQSSHELVGVGGRGDPVDSVTLVPVAAGEPVEVVTFDPPDTVAIAPIGPGVFAIATIDDRQTTYYGLDGARLGTHPDLQRSVLSPDGMLIARGRAGSDGLTMTINPLRGPVTAETFPYVPLSWLPAPAGE